ncbi:MAG: hypothetical protein F4239_07660 [Gammaproteobacteria bacterium]|nr:hypothetical protein [Gammaproteobacteria bacterium]MYI90272.1 hypothetical protein [Gammaproteobacteria bacterium]
MIIDELFDQCVERLRAKAILIPPLDGVMRPNSLLDEQPEVSQPIEQPDNVIGVNGQLWLSSKNRLLRLDPTKLKSAPQIVQHFDTEITCMAGRFDGIVAMGFDDGTVSIGNIETDGFHASVLEGHMNCPTAMAFDHEQSLFVCEGSSSVKPTEMIRDLMQTGCSGSVWQFDLRHKHHNIVAKGLSYPYGVAAIPGSDEILVSECWKHRIVKIFTGDDRRPEPIINDLPGYPARLTQLTDGDSMLCLFAPRNRLIEFVLRETEFRQQMIETIDPEYWIAPTLKSVQNFLEPLQQGGVKTMNIHKPWAPSFSYGLVVRLDANLRPMASYHSRANGRRHGVTSCGEISDQVYVTSKGGNCIVQLTGCN